MRNVANLFYKNNSLLFEPLHDRFVVNDLVEAINGSGECSHHPRECLNRHFYASAEAAGGCKQNNINLATFRVIVRSLRHGGEFYFCPFTS